MTEEWEWTYLEVDIKTLRAGQRPTPNGKGWELVAVSGGQSQELIAHGSKIARTQQTLPSHFGLFFKRRRTR